MKTEGKYLSSGEFAKLCKTSKVTLRHYKDIGLLKPAAEGRNGYLYYEPEQFYDYYLIYILKKTGTSLAEIKAYQNHQNPQSVLELLKTQKIRLSELKCEMEQMERVVSHFIENIEQGLDSRYDMDSPVVEYQKEEHMIAIPVAELQEKDEEIGFISLLHRYVAICQEHGLTTDYQTGAILSREEFLKGKQKVTHIYTKIEKPNDSPYYRRKPSGFYFTLLDKGHWDTAASYETLLEHIKKHHRMVTGDVYAYDLAGYLLNGIEEHTMSLIMVPVDSR